MHTAVFRKIKLNGETGELVKNIVDNWLLRLRKTDPGIIYMFRDRDLKPYRNLLGFSGEFAGKHSIFVGPILYGVDNSENRDFDFENLPVIFYAPVQTDEEGLHIKTANGLMLTDFYHLGQSGSFYKTWLKIKE